MGEEIAVENGRISDFQELVTLTLTLDRVILHTIMHHSSTSTYIPNLIEIEETFCGRTDGQTDGRANGWKTKNPWSFASLHCKWEKRQPLKMAEFPTFRGL